MEVRAPAMRAHEGRALQAEGTAAQRFQRDSMFARRKHQ